MQNRNTLFVGKVLLFHHSVESTNATAQELLAKSNPTEGTAISAYQQTAGRGQIGSTWVSQAGKNLTLSVILYPRFLQPRRQFLLNQAVSLAVRDTVAAFVSEPVFVKWPNDIYINQQKTAGILIQNQLSGSTIQSCIVGVGLNVNQGSFPAHLPNPTAMILHTANSLDLEAVQQTLFSDLERRYLQLRQQNLPQIQADYLKHLYRYGVLADYERADGSRFRGTISGLTENGRLQIDHAAGTEDFEVKSIKFI